jgi:hypothetical protein
MTIMAMALLVVVFFGKGVFAQEKVIKEMLLQVKPDIIALPEGEAASVPLGAARVRSSELRELNAAYMVVSIEKIYKLKATQESGALADLEIKGTKDVSAPQEEKEQLAGIVDPNQVFTSEIKKQMLEKGEQVVLVKDVYLLRFEFDEDKNMSGIVDAYKAVPAVIYANHITRR